MKTKMGKLIKMSDSGSHVFIGVNREDEFGERPKYITVMIPEGGDITKSYNDGYYGEKTDEPYFSLVSTLGASSIFIPFSELSGAAYAAGYDLVITKKGEPKTPSKNNMYQMSGSVGLSRFQPIPGGGKICQTCEHHSRETGCEAGGDVMLERFNDQIEYCHEIIHPSCVIPLAKSPQSSEETE